MKNIYISVCDLVVDGGEKGSSDNSNLELMPDTLPAYDELANFL